MEAAPYKYWAFISYSHRDQAWAEWLHRALETYRVPRRLVGREASAGAVPRRLFPVFRDQEELPSSPNLSGAIDLALLQSRHLIVIASPHAAVSKWVDQEIARFRALGRGERILCLIVDGEPHAGLQPDKGLLECFPPALRAVEGVEPIAADVRPGRDGKPAARLKLIAGLLGVGLDELRRREQRRRRLSNIARASAAVLLLSALGGIWQYQRHERSAALARQALQAHIETVYEKGRQELLARNQARAAVYFNEAYRLGVDTPALRFMLGRAMRVVESERLAFDAGGAVRSVRYSPDMSKLVTSHPNGVVRVWDAASGRRRFEITLSPSITVSGPTFSRDSRLLYARLLPQGAPGSSLFEAWDVASGRLLASQSGYPSLDHSFNPFGHEGQWFAQLSADGAVEIREVDGGRLLQRLPGSYSLVGFSRDGRRLLSGDRNGDVAVRSGDGRQLLRLLRGLRHAIVGLDDSEDGSEVAAASLDGSIRVWSTGDGSLRLIAGHPSVHPGLIFNLDGSRLLSWANDGVRLWDTASGALVYARQSAGGNTARVDVTSSGRWVMISDGTRLLMRDAQSGGDLFSFDAHRGVPAGRDISENDHMVVTGGPDGRVVQWQMPQVVDFAYPQAIDPLRWADSRDLPAVAAAFSHAQAWIATGAGDGRLRLWDTASHRRLFDLEADPRGVTTLVFSADDSRLLSGGETAGIAIRELPSGRLLRTIDCAGRRILALAYSRDGQKVAAALRGGLTQLWNASSGELLASFERDDPRAFGFSPDGRHLAVGMHGEVRMWDLAGRRFLWSSPMPDASGGNHADISALDFSPDGSRLLAADEAHAAAVLDAASGRILAQTAEPAMGSINSARFDHSGAAAVMGGDNGMLLLWRPSSGDVRLLAGHVGQVRSAAFSPDDRFILSAGADGSARIWSAEDGEQLDLLGVHASPMPEVPFEAASFSPDGRWVLTGSADGDIRQWQLREETRSASELQQVLRCRVPWRIDGEDLQPQTPDSAACPG